MITIFLAFALSLSASLVLTPFARKLGVRLGAMDVPDRRKVHCAPVPRTGGLAIFLACVVSSAVLVWFIEHSGSGAVEVHRKLGVVLAGAAICFAIGLVDDFRGLAAGIKLMMQIVAATVVFAGGVRIGTGAFADLGNLGVWVSYGVTVFWFLLFINAVNLIDGLDGLAGGVSFCAATVMVVVSVLAGNHWSAMLFAILAGSILGFLRYNFNPASIFLGDGGSYFIGFAIAGLSILANFKEQTGAAILIPMIAMGVPLFDTAMSSVRRFVRGRNVFGADRRHVHHRLLEMGWTTRRAVLLMYLLTLMLCVAALALVNLRDEKAGLVLVILFVGAVIFSRELGYFRNLHPSHFRRWLVDVSHATGFSRQRRVFLDAQFGILQARSDDELWSQVRQALELMEFDHARLVLDGAPSVVSDRSRDLASGSARRWRSDAVARLERVPDYSWDRCSPSVHNDTVDDDKVADDTVEAGQWYYRLELPLACEETGRVFGTLVLVKDHGLGAIGHFTLQSVEHLRRAVIHALDRLAAGVPLAGSRHASEQMEVQAKVQGEG